jgi:uncharacterized YigZ family protein
MLSNDSYLTLAELSQGIYKEKGSKFIALACPVFSEAEVKERLAGWRKEYHDARHHCYAYRLGKDNPVYRVNDDGEPSGSAGRPIYGQIQSKELTNVLVVVIRYFGGTKLGIPGLINAYKTSTLDAFNNGRIITRTITEHCSVIFDYLSMNEVMKILKEENAQILEQAFDSRCRIIFSIRRDSGNKVRTRLQKIEGISAGLDGEFY